MQNKKYEMIIFDIDGTLWDAVEICHVSLNYTLLKNNILKLVKREDVKDAMGLNTKEFAKHCMPFLDEETAVNIILESDKIKFDLLKETGGKTYPLVKETIEKLSKKYKISVVSNCREGYLNLAIEKMDIKQYLIDFKAASTLGITKAEAIRKVMDDNNIKSAIYVGDTLKDKTSCIDANIDFVLANYGFGKNVEAKYKINEFKDLISMMDELER